MPTVVSADQTNLEAGKAQLPPIPTGKQYFGNIEGARAVAALAVFFSHLHLMPDASWLQFVDVGKSAVVLFFFISGYLVLPSFSANYDIKRFLIGRFFRLYPVYWLSVFLAVLFPQTPLAIAGVLMNLTMFQQFAGVPNIQSVYWTLTIELVFYIVIIFVSLFARSFLDRKLIHSFHLLGIASLLLGLLRMATHQKLPLALSLALLVMCFGAIVRRAGCHNRDGRLPRLTLCLFGYLIFSCLTGYSFATTFDENPVRYAAAYCLGASCFLLVVFRGRFFAIEYLQFLGRISYGFYVLHLPIIIGFTLVINSTVIVAICALVTTIIAAALAHFWVEIPCIALGRKLNGKVAK